ncbi:MAG TPA: hypothetical protein VIG25_05955 [Pyrinomonadaceae bacterium]
MKSMLAVTFVVALLSLSVSAQEHSRPSSTPSTPRTTNTPRPSTSPSNLPDTGGWVRFTSPEGRFTVLMPETPTDKQSVEQSEHGPFTTHLFIVRDTQSVYLIGWVDYDPNFNFNRSLELEANRDNFVKGVSATLLTTKTLEIDGYPALEFTCETPDRIFKSRVYMVGRRPYQIVIGSPKGQDDSISLNRFFGSFKINRP